MKIQLNGRSALVALAAIVAFGAYRLVSMRASLEEDALEELRMFLAAEYASPEVEALANELSSGRPVADELAEQATARILAAQRIEFPRVSLHGAAGQGDREVVARVEILVDGAPPPDGDAVRYYRMRYRTLSGWKVGARTTALIYWLAFV